MNETAIRRSVCGGRVTDTSLNGDLCGIGCFGPIISPAGDTKPDPD